MKIIFEDRVKETTTGTGSGNLSLAGAISGFRTFTSASPYNPFGYEIHAVDVNGIATGDWETGIGVMSSGALVRTVILDSSNFGSAVNFSAGTKVVSLTAPGAFCQALKRDSANSTITYFVDPASGSDDNHGITSSAPFLTIQHAIDVAVENAKGAAQGGDVFICLLPGDYSGMSAVLKRCENVHTRFLLAASESYVTLDPSSGVTIQAEDCGGGWSLDRLHVGGDTGLLVGRGSVVQIENDVTFISATNEHIKVRDGGMAYAPYGYDIGGGAAAHIVCDGGGIFRAAGTVTFIGNAAFSTAFAHCQRGLGHIDVAGVTYDTGAYTITGVRYVINANGVCWTNGGGASFLPGNAAGSETNGGKYL